MSQSGENQIAQVEWLKRKSELIRQIRDFFWSKGYWEAETPIISQYAAVEEHIESIPAFPFTGSKKPCYLSTSPEYPMKRLIARGAGNCFQISKVFRRNEAGELHNPEFTMLEWYKLDSDADGLMNEVSDLFRNTLKVSGADKVSYAQVFQERFKLRLDEFKLAMLSQLADKEEPWMLDRKTTVQEALDYLFSFFVQPGLGKERPVFVTDFPADQSSLAKINPDGITCARFEGFYRGVELCNGYEEITDPGTLRGRFEEINQKRIEAGKEPCEIDREFLNEVRESFPECSGVALGLDRLAMLALGLSDIRQVLAFPLDLGENF